jgi:hypothetical protein
MNGKSVKRVLVLFALSVFLLPSTLPAQTDIEVRYEPESQISQDELAQMLAPIALYPDVLLSQILIAAAYPFEVAEAERWVSRNPQLSGEALNQALEDKNWDISVLALCHYPKVLTMMADNLSWTARLGDAFVSQEQDVMMTVQELRTRASDAGHLLTTSEQTVIVEQRIIRIEPVSYDYIYVPAYDPHFIYGPWWIPAFPPFFFVYPGLVVTGPRIIFSPGIYVRYGYVGWSRFDWRDRRTVIVHVDRHRRHPGPLVVQKYAPRVKWAPDRDRRYVRERRAPEIQRYRPQQGEQKKSQEPARRKSKEVMTPARPVIERDRRSEQVKPPASRQTPQRKSDSGQRTDEQPNRFRPDPSGRK